MLGGLSGAGWPGARKERALMSAPFPDGGTGRGWHDRHAGGPGCQRVQYVNSKGGWYYSGTDRHRPCLHK
jgi:hypothetical protein